jgi:glutamate dehydrogenase
MILETAFPDGEVARPFLDAYFPERLRRDFAEHFEQHTLRREIVATAAVNHLVNHAGISFLSRVAAATRAGMGEVLAAYLTADRDGGAAELRRGILAPGLAAAAQHEALLEVENALEAMAREGLEGKKGKAKAALDAVRKRLKL